ncbi:MAG: endonuclease domain-containing protein [Chitinophagaceae bacterium]|jgi:cyclase|nr:endonuclease domain-containing protein [Chitinophagaceae bacterium]MBK7680387.1 endonuclease domain-containing protein [Chitinophagaceae bacterium]MBK8301818.1 endonuclease domain-containing protein [Chitinophagaceae bacterium]MBK9465843.1 endonuclease domain-containing protein [Chitinophagaceae bacterium]MBK9661116.1 endonuclease domain-containing protein [Chitinophagaceae bacterium]
MSDMFYGAIKPIFARAEELRKNQTEDEKLLWQRLKRNQLGVRFKRQHPIWMYIADFYCHELKLVIEVDGSIHNVKEVIENDMIRQEDIVSFGIRVIRFTNIEVRTDIGSVISRIQTIINELQANQKNNEK